MAHGEQVEQQRASMASAREQELRLILEEERAERRLARAKARLERAYQRLERAERRVDRRTRQLKDAEAELLACQQRRASGLSVVPAELPEGEPTVTTDDDLTSSST